MEYLAEFKYFNFLLENMKEQESLERYVNECLILSEGKNVISKIQVFNEGVGDKVKEKWAKFTEFIKRVWSKFMETMTKVMNTDIGYLEKYKAIITGKTLKDDITFTMTDYETGIRKITSETVPMFNYSTLKPKLASADIFRKSLIADVNPDIEFADFCKSYFLGGDKEIERSAASLNMTNIYNFCHDKDKILAIIDKDQKTILNAANAQNTELKKLISAPQVESSWFADDSVYSIVKEEYITEFDMNKSGANKPPTTTPADDKEKKVVAALQNIEPSEKPATNTPATEEEKKAAAEKKDTENKDAVKDVSTTQLEAEVDIYNKECGTLLTAKMTAINIIYTNYMKIIRKHVKDYAAESDSSVIGDKAAQSGSDYTAESRIKALTKIVERYNAAKTSTEREKIYEEAKKIQPKFKTMSDFVTFMNQAK